MSRNPEGIALFADQVWQMTLGERSAIHGVLSAVMPALAIEIGTAEGACLRWIAMHAGEVHSFDLVKPAIGDLGDHVHLHTGDSHVLLPRMLERFAAEGRNVDFVLVDGDHSPEGVRLDIEMLLGSPAIANTVIVTHDVGNERVRAGLDAVAYGAHPKVEHVDLDFVPGYLGRDLFPGELWGGLGLIVVAADRLAYGADAAVLTDHHHGGELLATARDVIGGRAVDDPLRQRVAELTAEVEHHRSLVNDLMSSASWRAGAPLRVAKRALGMLRR